MARKTIEMRLAEIEAQKKTLKARLSKQERANDTRRKVLLGELVLHHLKARPDEKFSRRLEDFLRRILPRVLTRDVDKDLFADLLAGLRRRKSAPMLLLERPSERRCGTPMSEIDRDLHSLARGRTPAKAHPRLRDPRIYRPLRSRRGRQARRNGIAARKARPLPETLCLLERRPGAHRPEQE